MSITSLAFQAFSFSFLFVAGGRRPPPHAFWLIEAYFPTRLCDIEGPPPLPATAVSFPQQDAALAHTPKPSLYFIPDPKDPTDAIKTYIYLRDPQKIVW